MVTSSGGPMIEVLALLQAVDAGDAVATLEPQDSWPNSTTPVFRLGDLCIAVFNDCGDWDYVERVRVGGAEWQEIEPHDPLFNFRPEHPLRWPWPDPDPAGWPNVFHAYGRLLEERRNEIDQRASKEGEHV